MDKELDILNNDDVISVFKHDEGRFASGDTFKAQQLLTEYEGYVKAQTKSENNHEIFIQGQVLCSRCNQKKKHHFDSRFQRYYD